MKNLRHRIAVLLFFLIWANVVKAQDAIPPLSVDLVDIARYGDQFLSPEDWDIQTAANNSIYSQGVVWISSNLNAVIQIRYLRFAYDLTPEMMTDYFDDHYTSVTYEPYSPYDIQKMCQFNMMRIHEINGTTSWGESYVLREWVEQVTPNELRVIFAAFPETRAEQLTLYGTQLFGSATSCDDLSGASSFNQWLNKGLSALLATPVEGPERPVYGTLQELDTASWLDPQKWELYALLDDGAASYGAFSDVNGNIIMVTDYQNLETGWDYSLDDLSIMFSDLTLNEIESCTLNDQTLYLLDGKAADGQRYQIAILLQNLTPEVTREIRFKFLEPYAENLREMLSEVSPNDNNCDLEEIGHAA